MYLRISAQLLEFFMVSFAFVADELPDSQDDIFGQLPWSWVWLAFGTVSQVSGGVQPALR
jgi:hypothetical protein